MGDGLLQRAFHASSDVQRTIVFDDKGRFLTANFDLETVYGVSEAAAKRGKFTDWVAGISADACLSADLEAAYHTCKPVCNRQATFSGGQGVGNYSVVPLLDVPDNSVQRDEQTKDLPLGSALAAGRGVRCEGVVLFTEPAAAGDAAVQAEEPSTPAVALAELVGTDEVAVLAADMKSWDFDVLGECGGPLMCVGLIET